MRLSFNLTLPEADMRIGAFVGPGDGPVIAGRSLVGFEGRRLRKFFPLITCLETLTGINVWQWERLRAMGVTIPKLYQSGVRYEQEPMKPVPLEEWQDVLTLYKNLKGDCEDLATSLAGEYQAHGVPAVPAIKWKQIRDITLIHVLTLLPNDTLEDPSKVLGMKGEY